MDLIIKILLAILLVSQIILMIHLFITNRLRYKAEKEFWKKQLELELEFEKNIKKLGEGELAYEQTDAEKDSNKE